MHEMVAGRRISTRVRFAEIACAVVGLGVFCAIALRIMTYEMRVDEQLYVPPARLLDTLRLYEDFFYNQVPGAAWWFHTVALLTGSDHVLMAGRLGVLFAWAILAAAIVCISYRLTASALATFCIAMLTLPNELFLTQVGMTATNNFLPIPFIYLGLGLFVLGVREARASPALIALAGFFLSVAVVFKISAVAFIPAVAIASFFLPLDLPLRARLRRVVLPLALGGLLGGLPILFYLVAAPDLFLAHVMQYHTGPHIDYWRSAPPDDEAAVSLPDRVLLAFQIWLGGSLAAGIVALLTMLLLGLGRIVESSSWRAMAFPALGVAIAVAAACAAGLGLLPAPGFPQYYAPPLIVLPLGLALAFAALEPPMRRQALAVLVAATAIVLVIAAPRLAQSLVGALHSERWVARQVHDDGMLIAQRLASAGIGGKVATLAPIYPLEGGLEVYPELATGPFAYRTGDMTPPDLAQFYTMTSPSRVGGLLAAEPPAALLLGFNEPLERPMLAYARENGYVEDEAVAIVNRYGVGRLYVRPEGSR